MSDRYANLPSERNDRTTVLGSDRHLRQDCKLVAKMLTLGVIPQEQMDRIISKAGNLLENCDNPKHFASLFGVVVSAARLEIQAKTKEVHHTHDHAVTITDEQRGAIERARELVAEAERRGLIVDGEILQVHSPSSDG